MISGLRKAKDTLQLEELVKEHQVLNTVRNVSKEDREEELSSCSK